MKDKILLPSKNILLPVRGCKGDEEAFGLACTLARSSKGMIQAIYVIEVARELPIDAEIGEETGRGEVTLAHIEDLARDEKCPLKANILQARQAGPAIVQEAQDRQADTIVLSADYKDNAEGIHMGTTISYILQHAHCPVLLWRNPINNLVPSLRG